MDRSLCPAGAPAPYRSACLALAVLVAAACDQSAKQPAEAPEPEADSGEVAEPDPGVGGGPAIGVPPLLDELVHPGWTNPNCGDCHILPAEGHTTSERHVCAQCHGANGACLTNGYNDSYNEHLITDTCNDCHVDEATDEPGQHLFTDDAVCANCHFRELGQRPCEEYMPPPPMPNDGGDDPPPPPPPMGEAPELSDELVDNCFDFPAVPFGPGNGVPQGEAWKTFLQPGQLAVDFTLPDVDGEEHTLSDLLAEGPVWLQMGSYTCPVYQAAVREALNPLVAASGDNGPYADQIQFVHVYNVEAHPQAPDMSPYGVGELQYSTLGQPTTFDERLDNARTMEPIVEGELMLVDGLDEEHGNNSMWCTYANCPACSFLIGRDGYIFDVIVRTSADIEDLKAPLDAFLATQ
ncbi:MAG: hypothetical protein AAF721_01305 [Myxococcota bacterium]